MSSQVLWELLDESGGPTIIARLTVERAPVICLQSIALRLDATLKYHGNADLQLCHERLHGLQKDARFAMGDRTFVEHLLHDRKQTVELAGFDDRPWHYGKLSPVETSKEVGLLLDRDNLLELNAEPVAKT